MLEITDIREQARYLAYTTRVRLACHGEIINQAFIRDEAERQIARERDRGVVSSIFASAVDERECELISKYNRMPL